MLQSPRTDTIAVRRRHASGRVTPADPTFRQPTCAARRDRFWELHDSLFDDQGHLDDPHLWARAERIGLDLDRFEADRRDPAIATRVHEQVQAGLRGGVSTTPTLVIAGELLPGVPSPALRRRGPRTVR